MSANATGRCNCGKFAFEVPAHQGVAACFCKCCVRGGGSLCSLNAVIPTGSIKFTKGSEAELNVYNDTETTSGKPMKRMFCGSCGSPVQSVPTDSEVAYFKYSLLDDPEAYTQSKDPNMILFTHNAPTWTKSSKSDDGTKGLHFPAVDNPTKYIGKQ